jgi:hypothetical protein
MTPFLVVASVMRVSTDFTRVQVPNISCSVPQATGSYHREAHEHFTRQERHEVAKPGLIASHPSDVLGIGLLRSGVAILDKNKLGRHFLNASKDVL